MTGSTGQRIKEAREAKGWTQDDLADALKTSRTLVSNWERDETIPRGSTRLKIANALEVSTEWLRTGEGNRDMPGISQVLKEEDYDGEALNQAMRWMFTQPDPSKLMALPIGRIAQIQAERGTTDVDKWHREYLQYRIHQVARAMDATIPTKKMAAIMAAAWAEGQGWGTKPEDDQLQRYIEVALA